MATIQQRGQPIFRAKQIGESEHESRAIPFLKWAGGKRWLVNHVSQLISKPINRYIEPFLGSGAVFFSLTPQSGTLSDTNRALIETYVAIQSDWRSVEAKLRVHARRHCADYYYLVRSSKPSSKSGRAAKFIYLNRTCWNGLYRVNLNGEFNVPRGTKNTVLLDSDDFKATSNALERMTIECSDFEPIINSAQKADLLFVDPPYTVRHKFNGFIKYNENLFAWDDQVRLSKALKRASRRGVSIISTNADHESIRGLYANIFDVTELSRYSSISGSTNSRGDFPELLITAGLS